jgi:predicted RNA-binding Zn ribbon-like protein
MARYDIPNAAPEPLWLLQRFVNTVDKEHSREWLSEPIHLVRWFEEAGFGSPQATEADVVRAHGLRSALRSLIATNNGAQLDRDAIATINRAASAAQLTVELDEHAKLHFGVRGRDVDVALGRIVAIAFSALPTVAWSRLKTCRNCNWVFYDYSRNRSAKWCSMLICGNRLKSRNYRQRKLALDPDARA